MLVDFWSIAVLSAHILAGPGQGPFPLPTLLGFVGIYGPIRHLLPPTLPLAGSSLEGLTFRRNRLPLLPTLHVSCVLPPLPRWDRRVRVSLTSPTPSAFPVALAGRLPHCLFRGLLGVHSHCGPHDPLTPTWGRFSKCFRSIVAS